MKLLVRPAEERDAAAVSAMADTLNVEHGKPPGLYSAERILADAIGPGRAVDTLVAELDGRLVGYTFFQPFYNTDLVGRGLYLLDLHVVPEMRSRGVGRALVAAVAKAAIERGCVSVWWYVYTGNADARRLYARLGAREEDVRLFELDGEALARVAAAAGSGS